MTARPPRMGRKWWRMAAIYRRFAGDYPTADFSDDAARTLFLHESIGAPLTDSATNGYAIGKKWMDVTVAAWKEDIASLGLSVSGLLQDGYPEWFLKRVGVLDLLPTPAACAWWRR